MLYNNDKLLASAFVKARAAIGGTVGKDAKGNFGRYATLAAITDAITEPLAKNGLAVIQEAQLDEAGVTVLTTLLHESGATMQFAPLTMPLTDRKRGWWFANKCQGDTLDYEGDIADRMQWMRGAW